VKAERIDVFGIFAASGERPVLKTLLFAFVRYSAVQNCEQEATVEGKRYLACEARQP
jgi:hypothetical protein